jgi:nucleoside-diphosphate-sugar epimerase
MEVGISGANGFIGRFLVKKHLEMGDKVHVLTRKHGTFDNRVNTHVGDLLDANTLKSFVSGIDVIYHCAAEIKENAKMKAVNVEGTRNLITAASGKIKHWVQLSSVGVYGPVSSGVISEEQPYNPINEYERTKLDADKLVIEAGKKNLFSFTIIRPSIVFGANMTNKSIFELIKTIDNRLYFFIGKKGASANYVPVENVIEALYLAGTHPRAVNSIYIISNWCTIEDFVKFIAERLSRQPPKLRMPIGAILFLARITSFIPRNPLTISRLNALTNRSVYSTEKIEKELGYKTYYSIEKGVEVLINQYKKNSVV